MLTIRDLSAQKELDREAMASVFGGMGWGHSRRKKHGVKIDDSFNDIKFRDIYQVNDQKQLIDTAVGNNVALIGKKNDFWADATVKATQTGYNTVSFF